MGSSLFPVHDLTVIGRPNQLSLSFVSMLQAITILRIRFLAQQFTHTIPHRIAGCVANFEDAAIRMRTQIPESLNDCLPQKFDWDHTIYEDATEQIPYDCLTPLGNPVVTVTCSFFSRP
jgi:hypothetical protein